MTLDNKSKKELAKILAAKVEKHENCIFESRCNLYKLYIEGKIKLNHDCVILSKGK